MRHLLGWDDHPDQSGAQNLGQPLWECEYMIRADERDAITNEFKFREVIRYSNPLSAGAAYIRVLIFYYHIKYYLLNMLKLKCDSNQQYLKTVDLHIVKSE